MLSTVKKLYNKVGRTFWTTSTGFLKIRSEGTDEELIQVTEKEGLFVSSLCEKGYHGPIFDFNFPVQLISSTTLGHSHLFLNKRISWEQYHRILEAMYKADLIDEDWYKECLRRGQAIVLAPGREKNRVIDKSSHLL